jgi:hypothetical protein
MAIDWTKAWEADVFASSQQFDDSVAAEDSKVDVTVFRLRCELVTQERVDDGGTVRTPCNTQGGGPPIQPLQLGCSGVLSPLDELVCLGFPADGQAGDEIKLVPTIGRFSNMVGGWINLDGAINPGHSGGPCVQKSSGRVVGWNVRRRGDMNQLRTIETAKEYIESALSKAPRLDGHYFIWGDLVGGTEQDGGAGESKSDSGGGGGFDGGSSSSSSSSGSFE